MKKIAIIICFFGFYANMAFAQSLVGTTIIDGRKVELLSNNTWRFAAKETANDRCKLVFGTVYFCGDDFTWKRNPNPPPNVAAQYQYDARNWGQFTAENIGKKDGVTTELIRSTTIKFTAIATGVSEADIPILANYDSQVSGMAGNTLVYGANFNGVDLVFANTILVTNDQTLQAITYMIGSTTFTNEARQFHNEFLQLVEIR